MPGKNSLAAGVLDQTHAAFGHHSGLWHKTGLGAFASKAPVCRPRVKVTVSLSPRKTLDLI